MKSRAVAKAVPENIIRSESEFIHNPAPATAGAAPPKKKAPRSECAIDTDR